MPTSPTAPGVVVALVTTGFAAAVVPKLPTLAVVLLGCLEVAEFAAGVVVGLVVLCGELSCPDVWDGVVVADNVVPSVVGAVPVTVVGDVAVEDGDVPVLVVTMVL